MSESVLSLDGLDDLFSSLGKEQQDKARYEISKYLRKTMRRRITDQVDVYDNAFTPRKGKGKYIYDKRISATKSLVERMRPVKMLTGFRDKAYLKVEQSGDSVSLGYKGRAGHIARVHNLGLEDMVGRRYGGGKQLATYPARQWMGINDRDEDEIRNILTKVLSGA